MKYLYFFALVLIISSCNRTKYVEFDGAITGISNGAFAIKDPQGNQVLSVLISDGKFHVKNMLPRAGFYDMYITPDLEKDYKKKLFEVYLEDGKYTITSDVDKLFQYPVIKSDSKIQNELTDYYTTAIADEHAVQVQSDSITDMLYGKNTPVVVGSKEYLGLKKQLQSITDDALNVDAQTLNKYISKNPQNDIEAFVLAQINYKKDPETYSKIYAKFTNEQKHTEEGVQEGDDLAQLDKLATGSPAPKISGKTLNGSPFDPKSLSDKKVILVEFWRADNELSSLNHLKLMNAYGDLLTKKNFTIVSISLDTTREDWVKAIQKQNLPWIQVSDLRGQKSPNVDKWMVSKIPTYDLVDGNWKFIKNDVDFNDVFVDIMNNLKK